VYDYVAFLQDFLDREQVSRIVDLGCGDWSVAQRLDWTHREYLDIEVVVPLVASNLARFGRAGITFVAGDACAHPALVPACDVILVKDVMQHLPNADVSRLLNLLDRCRFMIATNDYASTNWDCRVGDTRGLNLRTRPFREQPVAEHALIPGKRTVVLRGRLPLSVRRQRVDASGMKGASA
jgi:SAM-dependent methyltransferase